MDQTTKSYKREQGLTIEQLNAIDLLITGKIDKDVAKIVGVNRVTVTKWRNYDIYFQAELNKRRKELWNVSIDKIRSLIPKAIERLEQELESGDGWRVALNIIKITGIEGGQVRDVGHDKPHKILNELAEQRTLEELYTNSD
ncbi:hypothetical protein, partial [Priestia megaterium]|uniref:hypothetical protein n=1 Tax=Priestia megaterium TaxID=1404 RepID=UPI003000A559